MILFSGDYHLNATGEARIIDIGRLEELFGAKVLKRIKFQVILGDAGILWPQSTDKDHRQLMTMPWPVLFLPGNHEPIYQYPLSDFKKVDMGFGNPVYEVKYNIYYMPRGRVYTIEKHRFLVLGGALSIDKDRRTAGYTWWPEEYWSYAEKEELMSYLEQDSKFDYVLAHTGPNRIDEKVLRNMVDGRWYADKLTDDVANFNDLIDEKIMCKAWICGHWHYDWTYNCKEMNRQYHYFWRKLGLLAKTQLKIM